MKAISSKANGKPDVPRREDWDFSVFSGWPEDNVRHAWAWEMDRELSSGHPPFIMEWEIRQLEKHNELLKARLAGKLDLRQDEWEEKQAEHVLPDPKHPLEQKLEELDAAIFEIEDTLEFYEVDNEAELRAKLQGLRKQRVASGRENSRRLKSNLTKLRSHLRAMEGKRGTLLSEEEHEAICPSPKAAPPKHPGPPMLKSYLIGKIVGDLIERSASVEEAKRWSFVNGSQSHYSTIHAVEIDWTLSETELLEAFRNWLRHGSTPHRPGYRSTKRPGRKDSYRAWFQDLAIYRLSKSGVSRKEGLAVLNIKSMSAPNWAHAQARTRKRIQQREHDLRSVALNAHPWGGSRNWWDHFAQL